MASIRNIKKSNKYLTVDYSDFSHEEYKISFIVGVKLNQGKKLRKNF